MVESEDRPILILKGSRVSVSQHGRTVETVQSIRFQPLLVSMSFGSFSLRELTCMLMCASGSEHTQAFVWKVVVFYAPHINFHPLIHSFSVPNTACCIPNG